MKPNPKLAKKMREDGWISVADAAEQSGLSESAIRAAMASNALEGRSIGARKFVSSSSLVQYVGGTGSPPQGESS